MTSIVSGNGSTTNYQTFDDTQLQQATKNLEAQSTDTINSAAPLSTLNYVEAYVNPAGKVQLPQPTTNQASSPEQAMKNLQSMRSSANGKASSMESQLTSALGNQKVYYSAVEDQISQLTDAQLQELAYQPGMTDEALKGEVSYAVTHPDVDVPDNVRQIANIIAASALESAQQTLGPDWTPTSVAWVQDANIMMSAQGYFSDAVSDIPGLTPGEIQELHFAMENPDAVNSLSPRLKAIFQQVMGKVNTSMQKNVGAPPNWSFPSDGESATSLSSAFDCKFKLALHHQVNEGKVTQDQARLLEALHYNPNADVPNAGQLKAQLANIENGVLGELQKSWGFPSGYRPSPCTQNREAVLNGAYQSAFNTQLNNITPPLSADEKAAIRAAQGGTGPSGLSPELQEIADKVKAMATNDVIDMLGLPKNWTPNAGEVTAPSTSSSPIEGPIVKGLMQNADELVAAGQKTMKNMPETAATNQYMVFLTALGGALAAFSEMLTISQIAQVGLSKVASEMQLDQKMNQIEKQRKALDEMKEKQEAQKGGFVGALMNCLTWICNILLVIVTCGAALGLIIAAAAQGRDMASLDLVSYSFEIAAKAFGKPLGTWIMVIGFVVMWIIASLLAPFTFGASLAIQVMMTAIVLIDIYAGNGTIVTEILLACGIPETAAMIISMVICIIVSIIIDLIISAVIEVCTAGSGTAATVALWTAEIGLFVAKVSASIARVVTKVVNAIMDFIKLFSCVLKALKAVKAILKGLQELGELALDFMKGMKDGMVAGVKAAGKRANSIGKGIGKAGKAVAKSGDNFAENLADTGLAKMVGKGVDKLKESDAITTIKSAVEGLAEKQIVVKSRRAISVIAEKLAENFAFKNWDIVKEFKETLTSVKEFLVELKNIGDVEYHAAKVQQLKELKQTMSLLKTARNAEKTEDSMRDLTKLEEQLDNILNGIPTGNDAGKAKPLKESDKVLADKISAWNNLHKSEGEFNEAKAARDGVEGVSRGGDTRLGRMAHSLKSNLNPKNWDVVEAFKSTPEEQLAKAKKHQKALESIDRTSLSASEQSVHDAEEAAAKEAVEKLEAKMPAELRYREAKEASDQAIEKYEEVFDSSYMDVILKAKIIVEQVFQGISAAQGIQTNVLQGQIAMIKAEMEAYKTQADYYMQRFALLASDMQDSATEIGEQIGNIAENIQQIYSSNSRTMSQLAMAA